MRFSQLGVFALVVLALASLTMAVAQPAAAGKKQTPDQTTDQSADPDSKKKGKGTSTPGVLTDFVAQRGQSLAGRAKWKDQGKKTSVILNLRRLRRGLRLQGVAYPRADCKGRALTTVEGEERVDATGTAKLKVKLNQRLNTVASIGVLNGRDALLGCTNFGD